MSRRATKLRLLPLLIVLAMTAMACTADQPTETTADADPATTTGVEPATTEASEPTEPAVPTVLKVATTANITTWDPVKSFSTEALYLANVYEGLVRVSPAGIAEPLLAESWEHSDDGLTWTFHLKEGVTFHDGAAFDAAAVKASIEAVKERGGAGFVWAPVESIDVVDDFTVQLNLAWSAPVELIAGSTYGAWMVSPAALDAAATDETYFESGISAGTGPFMIESYTPDEEILLTKFEGYHGGFTDQADKVLLSIVPEAVQQQQLFEGGDVDLALRMPLEATAEFEGQDGYTVVSEPSWFQYVAYFNTLRPPLDDPKVRQALSHAIPYDDIIQVGPLGQGTRSSGPVPRGVWPYSEDTPQYAYDLDTARQLLAEAGYADGFSLRLTYAAENEIEARFAPLIKDSFAQIGVDLQIEGILFSQQWEEAKSDPANAQDLFVVLYWPTYADAGTDNLWSLFHSSEAPFFNLSYWSNPTYDGLIDTAATLQVTDPDASFAMYEEAQQLLLEEAPGIFFFDANAVYVVPDRVNGFEYNPNYPFSLFFYDMSLGD